MQKLKGQVTSLKASRDKLLAEVDRQSTEIERLLTHNATLEQVAFSAPACFACLLRLWFAEVIVQYSSDHRCTSSALA